MGGSMRTPLVAIVGLALALTACGTSSPSQAALPSGSIVIGVSQALTGDKADPGTAINQGYSVWAKQVNAAGGLLGHKVDLKVYDNQSLADTAVSQYERLVTVDKVHLLFGPFSSALTIPTSAVAAKYKMAFVEGAGGAPKGVERKFKYVLFFQPAGAEKQADPLVNYILSPPAAPRPQT